MTVKIFMIDGSRDIIKTRKPKWLFLTQMQLDQGLKHKENGYLRFIPITGIKQIDFIKGE